MRKFPVYHPLQVAKHVRTYFKGHLYIPGRGGFTFDNGRLMLPRHSTKVHRETVHEVNALIANSRIAA